MTIFLLGSGQHLHAGSSSSMVIKDFSSITFIKKGQIKYKKIEQGNLLIEEVSVDLDEEFHDRDNLNSDNLNNYIVVKNSLLDNWYLALSNTFLVKNTAKQFYSLIPNCGYSSPIYLRIGVFRI